MDQESVIRNKWDRSTDYDKLVEDSWLTSSIVRRYFNNCVTGDPDVEWPRWIKKEYPQLGPPNENRFLVLGCGVSLSELGLIKAGMATSVLAVDISTESVAKARKETVEQGFEGRVEHLACNINTIELEADSFDGLFVGHAFHHFEALEHIMSVLKKALKPGAIIIIDEYLGPSRFRWSENQLRIMNDLIDLLPAPYQKPHIELWPLSVFERNDPSEAIRSGEILPLLSENFWIRAYRPYGGTILHMLLAGIVNKFNHNNPKDVSLLLFLIHAEKLAMEGGLIGSDFAFVVAQNSPRPSGEPALPVEDIRIDWMKTATPDWLPSVGLSPAEYEEMPREEYVNCRYTVKQKELIDSMIRFANNHARALRFFKFFYGFLRHPR